MKKTIDQTLILKKKNLKLWKRLAGIWANKRVPDPLKWQRKVRKSEWI